VYGDSLVLRDLQGKEIPSSVVRSNCAKYRAALAKATFVNTRSQSFRGEGGERLRSLFHPLGGCDPACVLFSPSASTYACSFDSFQSHSVSSSACDVDVDSFSWSTNGVKLSWLFTSKKEQEKRARKQARLQSKKHATHHGPEDPRQTEVKLTHPPDPHVAAFPAISRTPPGNPQICNDKWCPVASQPLCRPSSEGVGIRRGGSADMVPCVWGDLHTCTIVAGEHRRVFSHLHSMQLHASFHALVLTRSSVHCRSVVARGVWSVREGP
jgi:hypothetical protein